MAVGRELRTHATDGARRIAAISITTRSKTPLLGTIEIDTAGSSVKFELNEDIAHELCTHLDHFLTQTPERKSARLSCEP